MRRHPLFLSIAFVSLLAGCNGEPADTGEDPPANQLTFTTGKFEIAAGDTFTCFYTDTFTDTELSIASAVGKQGAGGHHITIYWTDNTREPEYHECKDSEMVEWHQVAAAGKDDKPEDLVAVPEGLATRIPAGKQIVIQAHYINTTGDPMMVEDSVTLNLLDASEVKAYANYFATVDDKFEVPAQSKGESVTYCTVDRDLQTVLNLGHMHEWGKHYKLEIVDDKNDTVEVLRDDDWYPEYASHPPVTRQTMAEPFLIKKGTRLRQTCNWDNTTPDPLLFPREMCLAFFYYYPDEGEIQCEMEHL